MLLPAGVSHAADVQTGDVQTGEAEAASADENTLPTEQSEEEGAVSDRVEAERRQAFNPYVITAHKHNYMLPVSYTSGINDRVYQENEVPLRAGLRPEEVKFQISLKSRLNEGDLLFPKDELHLGITLEAWWQLYSSDVSSPFRETNYQPEIFYRVPLQWTPFDSYTSWLLGFEHQSNGQVQGLSRSWNRLYTEFLFERGNFVMAIRPWYRLPEDPKEDPLSPKGDDNPDILDYMGHGEIRFGWVRGKREIVLNIRGNTSTGKGAAELGVTFPLFAKFRGFVQYFNGYGDALIDYNHFQQRIGLGVALTNLF